MHQFFVEPGQIQGKSIRIVGKDVKHIKNVLRMKAGEELAVRTDVQGKEYRCRIETVGEDEILCTLCFIKEENVELPSRIYLFQCLPKSDKMELVIQKAVELGACGVLPVAAKRCVTRLEGKKEEAKLARWQQIAQSAAQQSRRGLIPQVEPVRTVDQAMERVRELELDVRLLPYELAEGMGLDMEETRRRIAEIRPGRSVGILIGPEGGFEDAEVRRAMEAGFSPLTLGKRILRTETAGLVVLSWLIYQLEGKKAE